jgi:predicted transport protein/RecB family endonuclease NucS
MPIFKHKNGIATQLRKTSFKNEKELQNFVEDNLEEFFNIRFLATEFITSKKHGGRIDTLGIDDNNHPVIIEYKWGENNSIINQGLFYLDWLVDHQGDFTLLVQNKLKTKIEVDFKSPRVLLIARSFSKYDKHAINRMSENIELWSYSRYSNDVFELKLYASSQAVKTKSKKQISNVNYVEYSIKDHISDKPEKIKQLFLELQGKIFDLESEQPIEEKPQKLYIAYRASKVFIQIWLKKQSVNIHFKNKIDEFEDPHKHLKNVTKGIEQRGVYCEFVIKEFEDVDIALGFIEQSYQQSI